jgi:hypothetical protein
MGIDGNTIPEKMAPYSILVLEETACKETEAIEEALLFLALSDTGDIGHAPEKKRALSVTAFLKNSPLDLDKK